MLYLVTGCPPVDEGGLQRIPTRDPEITYNQSYCDWKSMGDFCIYLLLDTK